MIDLSFLTEEEQEKVLAVLRRDAELKKAEEQRVRNLQQTVINRDRLKYMTGEWFYETKQLRHQDRIHGSDIIRASIKHTHKPMTILELSQIVPEKSSFVRSENKEVFVPAVLCGILQEPYMQLGNETRNQNQDPVDTLHDIPKLVVTSPTKKRKNPFNSEVHESHTFEEKDEAVDQIQSPNEEPLPSSDSCISYAHSLTQDPYDRLVTQNESVPMPVPDETAVSSSAQDCLVEVDGPGGRQTNSAALRGILKQLSTCSSTESLVSRQDLQTTVTLDSPTESGIDRKQVRFSFTTGQSIEEWQGGNEMGEHSMLDGEFTTLSEAENNKDFENAGSNAVGTHSPSLNENQVDSEEGGELKCRLEEYLEEQEAGQHQAPSDVDNDSPPEFPDPGVSGVICAEEGSGGSVHQETEPEEDHQSPAEATQSPTEEHNVHHQKLPGHSTDISVEATSDTKPSSIGSSKGPSHANLPKPKQRLLGLFRRDKNKTSQVQSPQKEEVKIAKQKESGNTQNVSHGDVNILVDRPASVKQEATLPEMAEVRTLQLTTLQKTPFNETVTSVNADTDVQLPEGLTNLNASCERENSGSKVIFTREDARHKNMAKTGIEGSYSPQTNSDVESMNNNLSDTAGMYQERYLSPQVDSNLLLDLSKEDGTYRANPVLIFSEESSDDCLTDSETKPHLSEPRETVISPGPSAVALNIPKKDHDIPVPLPRQFSSCPEEDRPVKISELKHFWEKEYTGPRVVSATVRDASIGSIRSKKLVFPDLQPSLDSKSDTQAQQRPLSPEKTPGTKDQDDEVRRSPSKTCHPRALPRESSSPTSSRMEGSPLRTFRIDIDPQTTVVEEPQVTPTPVPRQRKSPSHEALQSATQPSPDTPSGPLPLHPDSRGSSFDNLNTQQSSTSSSSSTRYKKASEKKSGPFTRLARSFVPQDYQHYLGPQEKSHVPPFNQEEAGESDAVHRPQNALRDVVGNQNDNPTEGNTPRIINQDITTKAWSLSRASSGSHDETSGPVMSALKRLSSRSMSSSKSLENLSSEKTSSLSPSALTPSNSTQMISSVSVPALQQDETDSDSFSETNLGWRRNTGSSTSNMSLSSGMASMSSVSGSITSIYPGDLEVQGSIQFAVNYIQKLGEFHIFVVHCRDLAIADAKKTRSDPYVKCYLVPDENKLGKRKTIVIKKTLNPTYNEILRFKIKMESLKVQNLNVSVWHNDTFGRNSFLGEVDLDLSEWDFGNTQINEYALKARVSVLLPPPPCRLIDSRGHMRLALRFLPQTSHSKRSSRMETGEVQIWVKDCKNLPQIRGVIMDPFVKCTVLPDTSRKSRQKTRVVKRTANPMFNHTMVYDGFRPDDLREACVEITVWDHDRLNNHYIGGLRLGLGTGKSYGLDVLWMDSTTDEANLWQRMLQSDGEWVEDALPLRMFVLAKSASK